MTEVLVKYYLREAIHRAEKSRNMTSDVRKYMDDWDSDIAGY